jgi:AcrR family transcriptional regulator
MTDAPDRRDLLIAAATDLLRAEGVAGFRGRAITARAGVGVGLLNHYFTLPDLRVVALERLLTADLDAVLPPDPAGHPRDRIARFHAAIFPADGEPALRLWVDAAELAAIDRAVAALLDRLGTAFVMRLAKLVADGIAERTWTCPDPAATALRMLALQDGLAGMVSSQGAWLSAQAAADHLRAAFALECPAV